MALPFRAPTPEDLVSATDSSRINGARVELTPQPASVRQANTDDVGQEHTSSTKGNQGWGFEFDTEAMARNGARRPSDNGKQPDRGEWLTGNNDSPGGNHDNYWRSYGDSQTSLDDVEELAEQQGYDWGRDTDEGANNWGTRHRWFSSNSEGMDPTLLEAEKHLEQSDDEETDDVWDVRGTVQWTPTESGSSPDGGEEEEVVIDELTRYWATPNVYDVIRPRAKRTQEAFSEFPAVHRYDGDNWGQAPHPIMAYNGEGYTSDVLIEQSKKEFWGQRDGQWILLNSDTRISHRQQERVYMGQRNSADIEDNFSLESYDLEKQGFVDEEVWRRLKKEPSMYSDKDGHERREKREKREKREEQEQEQEPEQEPEPEKELEELDTQHPKETAEPVASDRTPMIDMLLDLGFEEEEESVDAKLTTEYEEEMPAAATLTTEANLILEQEGHSSTKCNVGLLVDLDSDNNLIPTSNGGSAPSTVSPSVVLAHIDSTLVMLDTSPSSQEPNDVYRLEESPSSTETTAHVDAPLFKAVTKDLTKKLTAASHDSLKEFASPHDWLNKLARMNMDQFQESRADHKKEWTILMEKQEQDSQRIHDFIQRSNQAKPPKARTRIPVSLSIVIETKDFGPQEMRVKEEDDLKALIEDFCSKYNMQNYEMAIWVTVASAIKKTKKRLRRDAQQRTERLI